MQYDPYEFSFVSEDGMKFTFSSDGPNGQIDLVVLFSQTRNPKLFHLGFGNLLPNGEIDDMVKNRNLDRNKVLATVAMAAYEFLSKFPDRQLSFSGSTAARTRLYRMAITNNLELLQKDFELFGMTNYQGYMFVKPFNPTVNYSGFLVKRKL